MKKLVKNIVKYVAVPAFFLTILAVILFWAMSRYLYQEPARVVYTRATQAEFDWQSAKYPSIWFVFDAIKWPYLPDPSAKFEVFSPSDITQKILAKPPLHVGPSPARQQETKSSKFSIINVSTARGLFQAIKKARAEDVILLAPGVYDIKGHNIPLLHNGYKDHPITIRAEKLGDVTLNFYLLEGFYIRGAYWTIENLVINGACTDHPSCEHAFHIVGGGHHTVLENNIVKNFNSHVKISIIKGKTPDFGIIDHNIFYNDTPRKTASAVTLIDAVNTNHWRVSNNIIADFAKLYGNNTSYAAFFKGGGADNIFEKNLVMCEWRHRGGTRVGLSFGGGGSGADFCPNYDCRTEHYRGIIRNNIIMNCPRDVGIYLNKSADTLVHNNIIYNTHGIDARYETTSARIFNNVIDGRIRSRNGGFQQAQNNIISIFSAIKLDSIVEDIYQDPARGNFDLKTQNNDNNKGRNKLMKQGVSARNLGQDICGREHPSHHSDIGPVNLQTTEKCSMNMDFIYQYITK